MFSSSVATVSFLFPICGCSSHGVAAWYCRCSLRSKNLGAPSTLGHPSPLALTRPSHPAAWAPPSSSSRHRSRSWLISDAALPTAAGKGACGVRTGGSASATPSSWHKSCCPSAWWLAAGACMPIVADGIVACLAFRCCGARVLLPRSRLEACAARQECRNRQQYRRYTSAGDAWMTGKARCPGGRVLFCQLTCFWLALFACG